MKLKDLVGGENSNMVEERESAIFVPQFNWSNCNTSHCKARVTAKASVHQYQWLAGGYTTNT